jgi:hypothetical protein
MGRRIAYGEASPSDLAILLDHLQWRRTHPRSGLDLPDLGLDKPALKQVLDRKALIECAGFLMNVSDEWLSQTFAPKLGPDWRLAMGPKGDLEKLRYLATRVAADASRAGGINP